MNLTNPKLKPGHIWIIAAVLTAIVGGAMAYFWIMPIMKDNSSLRTQVASLQDQGSDANMTAAVTGLNKAKMEKAARLARFQNLRNRYFLVGPARQPIDLSNLYPTAKNLSYEHALTLGPIIERWIRSSGNTLSSQIQIPAAPLDPNALKQFADVYTIPLKGIRITGTFDSVMRLLRSTPSLPRLVSLNSVVLSAAQSESSGANSDLLTGAANRSTGTVTADLDMTVWVFPTNADKIGTFEMPTTGQNAGGGMGGPGMAPSGPMPSGPPMGPGGPPMGPGGPPIGPPRPGGPPMGPSGAPMGPGAPPA